MKANREFNVGGCISKMTQKKMQLWSLERVGVHALSQLLHADTHAIQ